MYIVFTLTCNFCFVFVLNEQACYVRHSRNLYLRFTWESKVSFFVFESKKKFVTLKSEIQNKR